jgi:hypothetical protein
VKRALDRVLRSAARRSLTWLLLACMACSYACGAKHRPGLPPRTLVLVTFEALSADRTSFHMHARPTTRAPDAGERYTLRAMGLDDLAAQGVVFANCYAPSDLPNASLASLLTGRSPLASGVVADHDVLPSEAVTLAEVLQAQGFETAAFVSAPKVDLRASFAQGFDTFQQEHDDRHTLSRAATWLQRDFASGGRAFVWIHLAGIEPPWEPRELDARVEERLGGRAFVPRSSPFASFGTQADFDALADGTRRLDARELELVGARYDVEVARAATALELCLRDAFDWMQPGADASEAWQRTLFVFAGTNGMELGENGALMSAGSLSERVLHVPLFVRHPDSLTGERIEAELVELADVFPTLCEWFETPLPSGVSARSLLPVLDSAAGRPFEPRPAFAVLSERVFSVRTERWHLVWNPLARKPTRRARVAGDIPEVALYEPAFDRLERHDLAAAHPGVVADLQARFTAWREAELERGRQLVGGR